MNLDRHAKRIPIEDPNCEPDISFEIFFPSLAPRLVEKCQSNCGQKLSQPREEGSLIIISNGPTKLLVNGEEQKKVGPHYIYFNQKYLKEYLHGKHNVQVQEFPYESIIIVNKETSNKLKDEECACLSSNGLHIQ